MTYDLNTVTVGEFTTTFTFPGGDATPGTNPEYSIVVGVNPAERLMVCSCGRPIDTTRLSLRLRPYDRRCMLADITGCATGYVCSDNLRGVVEQLEPWESRIPFHSIPFDSIPSR